jgi:hypothetical protein
MNDEFEKAESSPTANEASFVCNLNADVDDICLLQSCQGCDRLAKTDQPE